jgi:hypothetical protein
MGNATTKPIKIDTMGTQDLKNYRRRLQRTENIEQWEIDEVTIELERRREARR